MSHAEMPDKTDLWGVLRVLDESLKRSPDRELLPKGLTSTAGQISVLSLNGATVSAPQPTGGTSPEPPRRSVRTLKRDRLLQTDRENEVPVQEAQAMWSGRGAG